MMSENTDFEHLAGWMVAVRAAAAANAAACEYLEGITDEPEKKHALRLLLMYRGSADIIDALINDAERYKALLNMESER